jgi:Pilus assembly protein, PilO
VNTKQKVPPAAQIAIAVVAILLVAVVGWFGLVHPKNARASKLASEIDATNAKLVQAQAALNAAKHQKPIRVANLFRLVKAMPDAPDMSGILLQLNRVAADTGITFESIKPGVALPMTSYTVVPITLNFAGNFYDLSDFLLRLRNLVAVRHGELDATGRLFAVDQLGFGPAKEGFPMIEAQLTVSAFVYGAGAAAATPAAPTVPATTDTTSTDTTSTDAATPEGATAAGVSQ